MEGSGKGQAEGGAGGMRGPSGRQRKRVSRYDDDDEEDGKKRRGDVGSMESRKEEQRIKSAGAPAIQPGMVLSCRVADRSSPMLVRTISKVPRWKEWWNVAFLSDKTECQLQLPLSSMGTLWKFDDEHWQDSDVEMQAEAGGEGNIQVEEEEEEGEEAPVVVVQECFDDIGAPDDVEHFAGEGHLPGALGDSAT